MVPNLQVRKLRLWKVKLLAQVDRSHTSSPRLQVKGSMGVSTKLRF